MGKHYLDQLFNPSSIAAIGASDRINSVGKFFIMNLINNHCETLKKSYASLNLKNIMTLMKGI